MKNGTIEGFFGRHWTHSDRLAHCDFLKKSDYSFYIYAPKSDHFLRKLWHLEWSDKQWQELQQLSNHCKNIELDFGIGFSPFELHTNFDRAAKHKLDKKVERINQLNPDILCILFDDMRGDMANLADIQVSIVDQIRAHSSARYFAVCPSYYSEDPVLDKVFGQRPDNYLEDLGRLLPSDVDIFWTGAKVCSKSFTNNDIKQITEKLQRKPFLWDNYPVNDGVKMCNHLHLQGFSNRNKLTEDNIAGHAINPMNQAWLSQIPLSTLPEMYYSNKNILAATNTAIDQLVPSDLASALKADIHLFHHHGLAKISNDEKLHLINKYQTLEYSNFSNEIIDWLQGGYTFDPSCLTN